MNSLLYQSISPADLGLPARFSEFRPAQAEAIEYAAYECQKKFIALGLPTGSGKSLLALAIAKATNSRAVYLTATRGLQDQISREFSEIGLKDVRGRQNYRCADFPEKYRSCQFGHDDGCISEAAGDCHYDFAVDQGKRAVMTVSNYAFWLAYRKYQPWPCDLLICDECHDTPELVADHVAVKISSNEEDLPHSHRKGYANPSGLMPDAVWREWAQARARVARQEFAELRKRYRTLEDAKQDERGGYLTELIAHCEQIAGMLGNWVWEVDERGVSFDPIWPGAHCRAIWDGIPRVLLLSATLRPYSLKLNGLQPEEYDFKEWPEVFQPQLAPCYYWPIRKLTWRSTDEDYQAVIAVADSILAARADRRGIIQTGSYSRMRTFLGGSAHSGRFIWNESARDVRDTLSSFRESQPDAVLVSPSFATGFDFPLDAAEFQIILKVPYPDTTRRVMKERCKDNQYRLYSAIQKIRQMKGRIQRTPTDRGETFLLDAGLKWCMGSPDNPWHGMAPRSFRVWPISQIPNAPPKL